MSFLLLMSLETWAQNKLITGLVTDAKGVGLFGATVAVKNTKLVTTTKEKGDFAITVPASATTLVVSYVGYEPKEVIISSSTISISLQEAIGKLDEVVVNVGYGTQKKSVVTGAISSVRAKDLENVPNGRIEQALQGRVSGVTIASNSGQPGTPSTIRVRGITTFGDGGNNPLWVVDGVVIDAGGIGYLNQFDIESIEVLKDATSAAIYGTRAATGVILVTTKKGKSGKLSVNYNYFQGTSSPEKTLKLLNATQYAALLNEATVAGGGNVVFKDLSILGTGTDWQKAIFNNSAKRYTHELSLSGGNEKSIFYLSFGATNQDGIVATEISNYNKKNIRLNATHKISNVFTFGETVGYSHQQSVGIGNTNSEFGGPLSSAINLDPITPLVVTDPVAAAAAPYSVNPVFRDATGNPYGISSIVGQEMTNPIAYIKTRLGGFNWSDDIVGNAYLEAKINKHFTIKSSVGAKLAYWGSQQFTPVFYLSATVQAKQNSYGRVDNKASSWNIENTITYTGKVKNHNFTALLGQGAYVENMGGGTAVALYGLPIASYQDASFNFDIPQANRTSSSYDFTLHKLRSLFARLNYNYKEKYLFTGIYRSDGSTKFGLNNKQGLFPSFSVGWIVNKEDFWKTNNIVNFLKVRGGYGVVGNDAIRDFGYLSTVAGGFNYTIGNTGAITTGYAPTSLDNPDLKWEQTTQTNLGIEAKLFNALNITIEWYKKKTSGILRPIPIPGYVGVTTAPVANIADMENTGLELELGYRKQIGKVNFSANGSIATLKNNVLYVASDANFINGDASFQSMGTVTRTQVGQSYNSFYGYQSAGIFQNIAEVNAYKNTSNALIQPSARPGDFKWVDTNGDGVISDNDKQFLGSSIPKLTFGLSLTAEYKGFDAMIFLQGAAGNKIFQGLRRLDIGNANYQTKALSRWTAEGTSNDYPRLISSDPNGNFGKMSNFYLEKGDYARIKLVQMGYNITNNLLKKVSISKLRVYVTAENLLTLTNYTGYDPEIGGGVFGIDRGIYPQARSFIAGVQLQF